MTTCGLTVGAVLCGGTVRAVLDGSTVRAALVGSTLRAVLDGFTLRALLAGSTFRTVLAGAAVVCVRVVRVSSASAAGAGEEDGVEVAVGSGGSSVDAVESRPWFLATVAFVITGVLEALRFVRLAAATSGESCAEAIPATSRTARAVRSIMRL